VSTHTVGWFVGPQKVGLVVPVPRQAPTLVVLKDHEYVRPAVGGVNVAE
jgi:hypothetical protein